LLALTVTLFAAIFAFVTSFPSPPAQNTNQFQAGLFYSSNNQYVVGVNVTHLAGPAIPAGALIYLKSSAHPNDCPFASSVPVSLGISTPTWTLGQIWSSKFTSFPGCASYPGDPLGATGDNITVYIVNSGNLIFSVVLPGQHVTTPPTIVSTWVSPSPPLQGFPYRVFATVSGQIGPGWPTVSSVPGEPVGASGKMWYNASALAWQYNVTGGNTSVTGTGNYLGWITVASSLGQSATAPITVPLGSPGLPCSALTVQCNTYSTSTSFSHACGGACPLIEINVWNNQSKGSVTVSGYELVYFSGGATRYSFSAVNVNPGGTLVTIDPLGAGIHWTPSKAGTYGLIAVLTVTYPTSQVVTIYNTYTPITVT
jgi:hypothetical protein